MTEPNSQPEKPKDERRYDPELRKKGLCCDLDQYEMLKRCSDKKDVTEWNNLRASHPDITIWLQGANLRDAYLRGVYLADAHLDGAELWYSHLEKAKLHDAHLEGADLRSAHLEGAILVSSYLKDANLDDVHLERADLSWASLEGAELKRAILRDAKFQEACLKRAKFLEANVRGADLSWAKLQDTDFSRAIVDGGTLIWTHEIDHGTKFEGVGLDAARIYPATKQLLECNIRRKNWEEWYKFKDWFKFKPEKKRNILIRFLLWSTIGGMWSISNYGISTKRIILTFLGSALFFAAVYSNLACWFPPGIVSNLEIEPYLPLWQYGVVVFLRPIYFSVVTMTTLGFGDMYASAQSIWGHIFLTLQVILGYVLLGALITRFAVLFTAGGPAGKFADDKK